MTVYKVFIVYYSTHLKQSAIAIVSLHFQTNLFLQEEVLTVLQFILFIKTQTALLYNVKLVH